MQSDHVMVVGDATGQYLRVHSDLIDETEGSSGSDGHGRRIIKRHYPLVHLAALILGS